MAFKFFPAKRILSYAQCASSSTCPPLSQTSRLAHERGAHAKLLVGSISKFRFLRMKGC